MKTNTYLEPSVYAICDVYNYFIFHLAVEKTLYKIFSWYYVKKNIGLEVRLFPYFTIVVE